MQPQGFFRTDLHTGAAPDALRRSRLFAGFHIHLAGLAAGVIIGQPDDDDDPLTIDPELWTTQALDIAKKRKDDRERIAGKRAGETQP